MKHEGTDERFRHWAVQCLDSLFSFALSLCRDRAVAEDLVQETYVRALRAANRPHDEAGMRPWLFTILHNVWRNERRPNPACTLLTSALCYPERCRLLRYYFGAGWRGRNAPPPAGRPG